MRTNIKNLVALLFVLFLQLSFAQEKTISGKVTDADGLPLSGVTVQTKGTKKITQTDFDGKYTIVANDNQILEFRFLGMQTKSIVASQAGIVVLKDESTQLENVVINALGIQVKKNQMASAYSKVKGTAVIESGENSLIKGLSAKASNVNITSSSGDPGAGAYVQIRGQNTITGSTQPLYVIDGIPISNNEIGSSEAGVVEQSRVNDLNPNDIASLQILKGASASALWGYRAANGVILITTKKGKKGKMSVELNSSVSFDRLNVVMDLQDKFGQGLNGVWGRNNANSFGDKISSRAGGSDVFNTSGAYFVSGTTGNKIYPVAAGGKRSNNNFNQSNMDAVLGTGTALDNHVGISGGNSNSSFYLGLGKLEQKGVVRGSTYNRTSVDFSSETTIAEKTTFKSKFAYSNITSNRIQQGSNLSGLYLGLYRTPADFDNRDYVGTYYSAAGVPKFNSHRAYRQEIGTLPTDLNPSYNNPIWSTDVQLNPNTVDRYIAGMELKHEINKNVSVLGRFGLDGFSDKRITMFPISSSENAGFGSASEQAIDYRQYNIDIMALGDINLMPKLDLSYIVGYNFSESNFDSRGGSYKNFLIDSNKFSYDNALIKDKTTFLNRTYSKLNGGYFSAAFDFKDTYFLTLGGRLENTSTYGVNLKNYFYPTAEFGYKFTNSIQKSILTDGKLRLTYGQIASIPRPYGSTTYYDNASGTEGYGPGYDAGVYNGSFQRSFSQGNQNLKPEIKTEIEVGADLEFFKRIKLNATYYSNEVKNLLVDVPINGSSTYGTLYGNFASLQNKGIEIDFDINLLPNSSELKLSLFGNWARNRNLVTKIEGTKSIFLNGFGGASARAVEGYPMSVLWGNGFEKNTDGSLVLNANGFPVVSATEGVIGDTNPDWRGGLGANIAYKGFKFSTLFDASIGGELWDGTNGALNNFGRTWESANEVTTTKSLVNYAGNIVPAGIVRGNIRDFGAGPVLLDQSWYRGLGSGFGPSAEQFVKSATWARLRQITFSYKLDLKDKKILGFESVTFTGTARNLWLWTKDKTLGQDPETNLTGGSNGRGLQYFNSPNTKSLVFSVNLKF